MLIKRNATKVLPLQISMNAGHLYPPSPNSPLVHCTVNGALVRALIDTGSMKSFISLLLIREFH